MPISDRLRSAFLKPSEPGAARTSDIPEGVEELRAASKVTNNKERIVGLLAAPWAAAIGFLVVGELISKDPAARLASGAPNRLHVSVSLYHEVLVALLVLAVAMLVLAMLRKRLYLGIVMALYGLTLFNLHWWGFALPYLLFGAWLLVRAYRLQRALREATGEAPQRQGGSALRQPRASKRYTPPASARR